MPQGQDAISRQVPQNPACILGAPPPWQLPSPARLAAWEAAMAYVDDIKSGNITSAVALSILAVAFAAAMVIVTFLAVVR